MTYGGGVDVGSTQTKAVLVDARRRIMGRSLGLSPLVVLLSLLFWGWVWGGVGLLLAVPLTMVVKLLLEHSDARWLATLLGPGTRRAGGVIGG